MGVYGTGVQGGGIRMVKDVNVGCKCRVKVKVEGWLMEWGDWKWDLRVNCDIWGMEVRPREVLMEMEDERWKWR